MRNKCSIFVLLASLAYFHGGVVQAQDWPQFRGPQGNGVLATLEHPGNWGTSQNIAWTVDMPGGGLSSPIVVKDHIILTTAIGAKPPVSFSEGVRDMRPKKPTAAVKFHVVCLKLSDGSQLWEKTITEKQPEYPIHGSNSYATESPASDGERIFVYFAAVGTVAALDLKGNQLWEKNIGAYPTGNGFGTGSSITTGDGNVFVQCDNDESSFVVAFDAKSGEQVWRQERTGRTSWATPLFWKTANRSELVTCGSGFVTSYDPQTGKELWTISEIGMSFSSSPASDEQRIYFGNSGPRSNGPLVAVSSGMTGRQAFSANAKFEGLDWAKMQAGPGMSSPVSIGGYVYIPSRGIITCYSAEDGSVVYKSRLPLGSTAASAWAAGDQVFLMDENGKTVALQVGSEMKIVATNQIDNDLFWSTPAMSGKSLLIRGVKKLYCIRE
ncbi:MAG: outer membrane protein assembly factor BamB [Mariniblastus sp.]|jgi:outer membrane protein assembly factor BamB